MNFLDLFFTMSLLLIAVSAHEFSHGFVAYKCGDTTAKYAGRLTLNPIAHIDLFGTILLPLMLFISTGGRFVFGAAKPVPVNFMALKNPKRDMIWIGLSGPAANFLFAVILTLIIRSLPISGYLLYLLAKLIVINVVLAVFNLLPLPPLDGSRVVMGLLPYELCARYARIEPYGFIILFALLFLGLINILIWPPIIFILNLLGVPIL